MISQSCGKGLMKMKIKLKLDRPRGVDAGTARIETPNGKIKALVLRPEGGNAGAPGVLWIHGGGYFLGMKEMAYMSRAVDVVLNHGATVVAPDYTLAFRNPYPAALDDCMRTLYWMKDHCKVLGIRDDQLMVGGESAGGGLCRAVCLRARDEGKAGIAFQMPLYPMLDDRDTITSFSNHGKIWNTSRNHFGWKTYLRGMDSRIVPRYAAPARREDLSGMPPCYTFVGDGEPFFAETLQYVDRLRKAGVEAHADVYKTDIHAFDMLYPEMKESREAAAAFNKAFARAKENFFAEQP